jgi:drug/metabolite transporter (DMT)-like permease
MNTMVELAAVVVSLAGMYLTGRTERPYQLFGYMLWLVSNAIWALVGYTLNDVMMVVQQVLFIAGSVIAILRRRRA